MSFIGSVCMISLMIGGHKPKVFHGRAYIPFGKNWGGCALGCFFFCDEDGIAKDEGSLAHESFHGVQNALLGPLFPILIGIPSALRCWYLTKKYYSKGLEPKYDYDHAWFEGWATRGGKKYVLSDKL